MTASEFLYVTATSGAIYEAMRVLKVTDSGRNGVS